MKIRIPGRRRIAVGWATPLCVAAIGFGLSSPAVAKPDRPAGLGVSTARARDLIAAHALRAPGGGKLSFPSLKGEVVIVNFWASWCSPCRRELPRLDALHTELSGRGGRVLAISIDEEPGNAERFARRHHLKLPIYLDGPEGLARQLDLGSIPFTMVLDRNGEVAFTTSRSDEAGLSELAAAARQIASGRPYAAGLAGGGTP